MNNDDYQFPVTDALSRWMSFGALVVSAAALWFGWNQQSQRSSAGDVRREVAVALRQERDAQTVDPQSEQAEALRAAAQDAQSMAMRLETATTLAQDVLGQVRESSDALAGYDSSLQASGEGSSNGALRSLVTDEPEPAMDDDATVDTDALSETEENKFEVHATKGLVKADNEQADASLSDFAGTNPAGGLEVVTRTMRGGDDKDALRIVVANTGDIASVVSHVEFRPVEVFKLENSDPEALAREAAQDCHVIRFTEAHNRTTVAGRHGPYYRELAPEVTVGLDDEKTFVVFIANQAHVGYAFKGSLILQYNSDNTLTIADVMAIFVDEAPVDTLALFQPS